MEAIQLVKYKGSRKLLETLLKFPDRRFTINELSRKAGVPFASAWRMVRRLEPAGIVETGRVGRSVTVKVRKSEYLDSVLSLLKISMSPQAFAARELRGLLAGERGIKEAYLFGSVARGEEKPESDIDVALLVRKGYDPNRIVFEAYGKFGAKVVPVVFHNKKELLDFIAGRKMERLK